LPTRQQSGGQRLTADEDVFHAVMLRNWTDIQVS
jgi:hypothetical protein